MAPRSDRWHDTLPEYADELRDAALRALQEEAVLVALFPIYHADNA